MRLSEMKTKQDAGTFIKVLKNVNSMLKDPTMKKFISGLFDIGARVTEENRIPEMMNFVVDNFDEFIEACIGTKMDECIAIISIIEERPVAEIEEQPLLKTIADIKNCFMDGEMLAFFKSATK